MFFCETISLLSSFLNMGCLFSRPATLLSGNFFLVIHCMKPTVFWMPWFCFFCGWVYIILYNLSLSETEFQLRTIFINVWKYYCSIGLFWNIRFILILIHIDMFIFLNSLDTLYPSCCRISKMYTLLFLLVGIYLVHLFNMKTVVLQFWETSSF